jgi:hypothetical protein
MIQYLKKSPYGKIFLAAIIVRLFAVIFSQGYGMHDDHFLIIEASSSWVDGYDYNNWLPWSPNNPGHPHGHSFTYVGFNFLFFWVMKLFGIMDPKTLMLVNRLIHALASMIVVIYSVKITEKLSNSANAVKVGWIMALLWILPFVSVRNLVEIAAVPWLVYGVWLLIKNDKKSNFLLAGLMVGMAVSFRYQIGVFAIGLAGYYFLKREWQIFVIFCTGVLLTFALTQGLLDYFIWGYPFAEFLGYVFYNMTEGTTYLPNSNYFMYFMVLIGCFFLPLGINMMWGFFRSYKKYWLLFLPTLLFILFHTLYPNRQERFVLSILHFFIILGVMGYELITTKWKDKWWLISMKIFWGFNLIFLFFASTMYSKKSRVEAMYSLSNHELKNGLILLEGSADQRISMMPKFYSKGWHCQFNERTDPKSPLKYNEALNYDFIFFFDDKNLQNRIEEYKKIYPEMKLHKSCEPSLIDKMLRELNPRNANEYIEVWATNYRRVNNQ